VNVRRLLVLVALCFASVPVSSALASYSGAVGRVVFVSDRAGSSSSDIYSTAPDGTDVQQLTMWSGYLQDPVWSPDGSRIAYSSNLLGRPRVFVMNQDGTGQQLVSPAAPSTVDDTQPAWSPDGTKIAFASTRGAGGGWNIWVMNADGSNVHVLPGDLTQHPAWSPDGTQIAGDAGGAAVYVVNVDGTNERRLATAPQFYSDESPDWSPDGRTLVFSQGSGASSALHTVSADGTGEQQLTNGASADYDPSFAPDGTKIVFRRRTQLGTYQLYTVGAAGGAATQLTSSPRNDLEPSWGSATTSPPPPDAPDVQIFSPTGSGLYFLGLSTFVFYTCSSQISVVVSCTGSQPVASTLDTSSAGLHRFSVTATDIAGRQRTVTVIYTVLDFTQPTLSLITPSDGASYEIGDALFVDFACSDGAGGSGIQYCNGTQPNATPLDTSRLGTFTFQAFALDQAFNGTTRTATYRIVDSRPPSISIKTPADGASYGLGDHLSVSYSCADSGSGVQSCIGAAHSGSDLDTSQTGSYSFRVSASDAAGNTATATTTYTVVDRTPPSIVITTPADGAVYVQDDALAVSYSCADQPAGSGLLSCTGDLAAGAQIDTSTVGRRTFTVNATDNANNAATTSSSYRVVYGFAGFFQPVAAFPAENLVKAGEAIPLRFSLHGNRGADVLSASATTWTPCGSAAGTVTPASGSLSYNASGDRYTFLAATSKAWAGTCADLTITLRDGTAHQARFAFRK
jgi:Tol biopolymer transport system component